MIAADERKKMLAVRLCGERVSSGSSRSAWHASPIYAAAILGN